MQIKQNGFRKTVINFSLKGHYWALDMAKGLSTTLGQGNAILVPRKTKTAPNRLAQDKHGIEQEKTVLKNLLVQPCYNTLLGEVLALRRTGLVSTFRTVYSAGLQEKTSTLFE